MKAILIAYNSREGQTQKIAEYLADRLRARYFAVDVMPAIDVPHDYPMRDCAAAIVCASVHYGVHDGQAVRFVKQWRNALNEIPSAFLSVSMAAAGIQDRNRGFEERQGARKEAERMIHAFLESTGWQPDVTVPVAGALLYRNYNFLVRWMMRRIAAKQGFTTDTSRNWEFTDWAALDRVGQEMADRAGTLAAVHAFA